MASKVSKLKKQYDKEEKRHDIKYEKENKLHEQRHRAEIGKALNICNDKKKK